MAPHEIYILFGRRVAYARESAGLTQAELAECIGLSRASVANIEAGRQRIVLHQAIEISEALRLSSISDLLPTDLVRPADSGESVQKRPINGAQLSTGEAAAILALVANS